MSQAQAPVVQPAFPTVVRQGGSNLNPNYSFIFEPPKPPKKPFKIPIGKLPKKVAYGLYGFVGLMVVLILYSAIFEGRVSNADQLIKIMARQQEISRISVLVQAQARDVDTQVLASTTSTTLGSEQTQIMAYLKTAGKKKINTKLLGAYADKTIDTQMVNAAQNNNLSSTYADYLNKNFGLLKTAINTAYAGSGPKAQALLNEELANMKVIYTSPQLAQAQL